MKIEQLKFITMRRIFPIAILLLFFIRLNAQFTISTDSVFIEVITGNEYGTVDITNDSIGGEILWVLTTECEPENWVHYVMDMNINYIPGIDSFSFSLGANESGILRMFLLQSELPDMARYTMEIWEEGNRENAKFVNFFFNDYECSTTAIDDIGEYPNIEVYPNPFKDQFTIETDIEVAFLELLDMQGRKLLRQEIVSGKKAEIHVGELAAAAYCLVLKNKSGEVIAKEIVLKM
jgi:hypothetical protein